MPRGTESEIAQFHGGHEDGDDEHLQRALEASMERNQPAPVDTNPYAGMSEDEIMARIMQ